jgi:CRISPR-associated endoribonuclease Cas6
MDYQYYLSAWIYKVIDKADPEFSNFLHTEGYTAGNKRFKLFNYSPLNFGRPTLWKEKTLFEIHTDQLFLSVSFHLAEAAEKFIIGLFNNQEVYVGDQFNGLDLVVTQVERLPDAELKSTMNYRAVSPVVVSLKDENTKYAQYLSPTDHEYNELLKQNLRNKYLSIPNAANLPDGFDFQFTPNNEPKSKLITVKPYTPEQSKVRGFVFDFALTCPLEIHRLILSCGIGEKINHFTTRNSTQLKNRIMAYQFKIQLKNVTKPPVWRRVIVSEKLTFHDLHEVIQRVFGWDNYHLYQFSPGGYGSYPVISIPSKDDWEQPQMNSIKTKLNKVFTLEKKTFIYIYDFGDSWTHKITLEKLVPDNFKSPVCMAGKGTCPPEDCGGVWGYENLKIILADPEHEEHAGMKEWLGMAEDEDWDADKFDLYEVNEMLKGF